MNKITVIFILGILLSTIGLVSAISCDDMDYNSDGLVNDDDGEILRNSVGTTGCNSDNNWCDNKDIDKNGGINFGDYLQYRDLSESCISVSCSDADVNDDGVVNTFDLLKVSQCLNLSVSGECEVADIDGSGVIDEADKDWVREYYLDECEEPSACSDSDGGRNSLVKGKVSINGKTYEDSCYLGKLKEYYCEDGSLKGEIVDCMCASSPGLEGVCLEESICEDSEDPSDEARWYQDPYKKGVIDITYMNSAGFKETREVVDECLNGKLVDYSCSPYDETGKLFGTGFGDYIICENGCENGACLGGGGSIPGEEDDMETCLDDSTNYWDQETDKCYPGYSEDRIKELCSDPDGGKNYYEEAHTFGFRSYSSAEDPSRDLRIRTGGKDYCSDGKLHEHYCDEKGYISNIYYECPAGCSDFGGACKKGEVVSEQVKCVFRGEGASSTQRCYAAERGDYSCESKFYGDHATCVIDVKGYKGEKITWKSSCGGYAYTVMDGNSEYAEFECESGEVDEDEIEGIGFRFAFWECYDGAEQKSKDKTSCKSSEVWQKYAKNFCEGRCSKETEKCGVNSFSVWNECYLDDEPGGGPTNKCGDDICQGWELTETHPFYCPEDCEESELPEETLICKNSCPLEDKCYPFGYRKSGKYCSDEGMFTEQSSGDESCDNNFECKSNVCVNSECVSESLIKKIIDWFKRIFGRE